MTLHAAIYHYKMHRLAGKNGEKWVPTQENLSNESIVVINDPFHPCVQDIKALYRLNIEDMKTVIFIQYGLT